MNKIGKITIVGALMISVAGVIALKRANSSPPKPPAHVDAPRIQSTQQVSPTNNAQLSKSLPRLVDLGADKCIPCKMMAPILEELKTEYAGKLQVDFFDVWKNPDVARKFGVQIIPTQIFFDASGKELFRHEGFFSKQDILKKWKELGISIENEPESANTD